MVCLHLPHHQVNVRKEQASDSFSVQACITPEPGFPLHELRNPKRVIHQNAITLDRTLGTTRNISDHISEK